jgi:hypothetical protein
MSKAVGTIEIDESLEVEIARSLHQSKSTAAVPHPASAEPAMSADKLGTSFRQMAFRRGFLIKPACRCVSVPASYSWD